MSDQFNEQDFDFEQGADAVRESAKTGVSFDRVDFLRIDGSPAAVNSGTNRVILRYLTDYKADPERGVLGWIPTDQHAMVPTKPKPADMDKERSWPKSMSAVCRNGRAFKKKFGDCYICESIPDPKTGKKFKVDNASWAIAVLREEVIGDGSEETGGPSMKGRVVGYRDAMKEVAVLDDDGKPVEGETKWVKSYIKVNQKWGNFFNSLNGFGQSYKTVLDRDYVVSREGTGLDTEYHHVPLDPIDVDLGEGVTTRLDLRDPELRAAFYGDAPNLMREIASQASDEYFQRWFIPGGEESQRKDGAPAAAPSSAGKAKEPEADRLAALRERVKTLS